LGLIDHLAGHLEELRRDRSAAVLRGRPLQIADRFAEQVGRSDASVAAPDVGTDDEADLRAHDVRDRLAPPPPTPPAGPPAEPPLLETPHRCRDRRLGEVCGPGDLRPRDRAPPTERLP